MTTIWDVIDFLRDHFNLSSIAGEEEYTNFTIDLSSANSDKEYIFNGSQLVVSKIDSQAYIKFNSRRKPLIDLRQHRTHNINYDRFFITNDAGSGTLELLCGRKGLYKTDFVTEKVGQMEFWSKYAYQEFTTVQADKNLSSVTLPNLTNYTIEAAYPMFYFGSVVNTNAAANYIDSPGGVEPMVQCDLGGAGWLDCCELNGGSCWVVGNGTLPGVFFYGNVDIKSKVDFNSITTFRVENAVCHLDALRFYSIYSGIRVIVK